MPNRTLLIFALLIGLVRFPLAQVIDDPSFAQTIDVQAYSGNKFRLSAAVKASPLVPQDYARLFYRLYTPKGQMIKSWAGTFSPKIHSDEWKRYFVSGSLPSEAGQLEIGGMCFRGGEYFFDDFKLEIETAPDQWRAIPIANAGFEQWTDQGLPLGWGGTIPLVKNFAALPAPQETYSGAYSLLLASSDAVDVRCKYEVLETYLPARLEHLTQEDGLPGTYVTSLHQDSRGFIWVGTWSGLARYDGHGFKVYQHDPGDSTSISANDVATIYEDRKGGLWIGTISGGVNFFDPKKEQFERFTHHPEDPFSLGHNRVTTIFEGREGYIWAGGHHGDGLNRLDRATGKWKSYKMDSISPTPVEGILRLQSAWINSIKEDTAGRLWLGSYNGLIYMDRKKEQFHQFSTNTDEVHQSSTHHILSIYPDADGTIWVASESGLNHFDPDRREFTESFRQVKSTESGIRPNLFPSMTADSSGHLWLCWAGGISRFDPKTKKFYSYRLHNRMPQAIMVDREGLIWIGTDKGISRLNPYKNQFFDDQLATKIPPELSTADVNGPILQDSYQQLWASTEEGIFQVDLASGAYRLHTHPLHDSMYMENIHWVHALYEGHEQDIWVGVSYNGLLRWNRSTEKFTYLGTLGEKGVRETFRIFEDRLDTLWLSTWSGSWIYDRSKNRYQKIPWRSADGKGRTWTRVTYTTETKDGTLWMGTNFGELKRFDRATRRFHDFTPSWVDTKIQLNVNTVTHIHEGPAGILWVSTMNNGFYRLDTSTRAITFFRQQHGLINNSINKIMEDEEGRLWICTTGGLSRFDPVSEQFRNFDVDDGLPAIELGEAYQSPHTGIFYIGSRKGLVYFHPDSIRPNRKVPPVVFTTLATYAPERGTYLPVPGISDRDTVTLSHQDDLITVEFAALSYSKTAKQQYAYRLQGLNDEWIALGTKREITLSNLPPGRYTLQVKGSNGDGTWNESGASLLLFITPPWYWSPGTKVLYLILASLILYLLYRFQLNRQLVQAEVNRLAELDTFKSRLYTNITHEFRTPLTVISGTAERTIERAGDLPQLKQLSNARMIKRNSDQLLRLVNQMLDLRKLESGTLPLNLVNGDVLVYLKYLTESLHSLATVKNINLQFEAEAPQIQMDYDPEKLESIIYNLLTNAIKFTPPGGRVRLLAKQSERELQIQVQDSGVGIPPEKLEHIFDRFYQADDAANRTAEGTGIGLALTRELVKLLGGKITVESWPEKGTTFHLSLPITQTADRAVPTIPTPLDTSLPAAALPAFASANNGKTTDLPLLLIVEDNVDVVSYLYDCLHDQYRLAFAQNGQVGIEKALEIIPDLIVSDVMMPVKDGFELCHTLKADERTSHIPIVLLTAKADLESKLEGLQRGADVYLPKPFHKTELLIQIKNLLEIREQLRQYYLDLASESTGVTDTPQPIDKVEDQFVRKIRGIVETHLDDHTFSVAALCRQAAMSRSQLHRKIKALTGYTASRFIRFIRLAKAKKLLLETDLTIAEIAYRTGFQDPVYFSRVFRKEFSAAPSTFRKQYGEIEE